jgi:hypothetical protein
VLYYFFALELLGNHLLSQEDPGVGVLVVPVLEKALPGRHPHVEHGTEVVVVCLAERNHLQVTQNLLQLLQHPRRLIPNHL